MAYAHEIGGATVKKIYRTCIMPNNQIERMDKRKTEPIRENGWLSVRDRASFGHSTTFLSIINDTISHNNILLFALHLDQKKAVVDLFILSPSFFTSWPRLNKIFSWIGARALLISCDSLYVPFNQCLYWFSAYSSAVWLNLCVVLFHLNKLNAS